MSLSVIGDSIGGFEGYLEECDRQAYQDVCRNIWGYTKEKIRERIKQLVDVYGTDRTEIAQERTGKNHHFCVISNSGSGGDRICCAPLMVYAILFGWWSELEEMLENGWKLAADMNLLAGKRSFFSNGWEFDASLSVMGILMNQNIAPGLLEKCAEKVEAENMAAITPVYVSGYNQTGSFLNSPLVGNTGDFICLRESWTPYITDADINRLQSNLQVAAGKAPGLFRGDYRLYTNLKWTVSLRELLKIMEIFAEVYTRQDKMIRQLLWYGNEHLNYILIEQGQSAVNDLKFGNGTAAAEMTELIREKGGVPFLLQQCENMSGQCTKAETQKSVRAFFARLTFLIGMSYQNLSEKEALSIFFREANRYFEKSELEEQLLETGTQLFQRGGQQVEAAFTFAAGVKAYRRITGMGIELHLEDDKTRKLLSRILNLYLNLGNDECEDTCDRTFLLRMVENAGRFTHGKTDSGMLSAVKKLMKGSNEELLRACLLKNLISQKDAETVLDNMSSKSLGDKETNRFCPLLLLKKYEMI